MNSTTASWSTWCCLGCDTFCALSNSSRQCLHQYGFCAVDSALCGFVMWRFLLRSGQIDNRTTNLHVKRCPQSLSPHQKHLDGVSSGLDAARHFTFPRLCAATQRCASTAADSACSTWRAYSCCHPLRKAAVQQDALCSPEETPASSRRCGLREISPVEASAAMSWSQMICRRC